MISNPSNLSDLKNIFQSFLNIEVVENQDTTSAFNFPDILRLLYQIKGAYNQINPSNNLFATQDRLTPYSELKEIDGYIDVLEENQCGWICSLDAERAAYLRYSKDSKGYERLDIDFNEILTTYALIELLFILPEIANGETDLLDGYSLEDIENVFSDELKPLFLNKLYVYSEGRYSFYHMANNSLYLDGGDSFTFFGTTDVEKYEMI